MQRLVAIVRRQTKKARRLPAFVGRFFRDCEVCEEEACAVQCLCVLWHGNRFLASDLLGESYLASFAIWWARRDTFRLALFL